MGVRVLRGRWPPQKEITTEIAIRASVERVWSVLADFGAYQTWNPLIRRLSGPSVPGARLQARVQAPGRRAITFWPKVIALQPNQELRLQAALVTRHLLRAEHRFAIERAGGEVTRFVHSERFTGLLVPFLARVIEVDLRRGFELMDRALKNTVETAPRGAS